MRRLVLCLALLLGLFGSSVAAERIELVASAAQTASGNSASFRVSTLRTVVVGVDITAGSGTITDFDCYLEVSDDAGTTWYEMPADIVLKTSATGTANSTTTNVRDIVASKTTTTAEKFLGVYQFLGADYVRLRWIMAGTTPSLTFSASLVGK